MCLSVFYFRNSASWTHTVALLEEMYSFGRDRNICLCVSYFGSSASLDEHSGLVGRNV